MGWGAAIRKTAPPAVTPLSFVRGEVDWKHLISLDFETFYDKDYTLRKLSTSEYIRDPRFQALMVGVKIGRGKTKLVPGPKIAAELAKIDWKTHDVLCHHAQFDAFILSQKYNVWPRKIYCTLSMARGLHSNDIGAGLDEVSQYYGGRGKLQGGVEDMAGKTYAQLFADKPLWKKSGDYCINDVDEMFRIFEAMLPKMPADELDIIDVTCRMFTDPVLLVDLERVQKELEREIANKQQLFLSILGTPAFVTRRLKGTSVEDLVEESRKVLASNEKFAALLRAEGIDPPMKISPAYIKSKPEDRNEDKKWAYAFSKTDLDFTELSEHPKKRVRELVEARLAAKSTINETRAGRFLIAGANGQKLPVYLRYFGAHTGRWSAGNKMNMQNLPRGGELRKSIKAPPGYVIVVADSGQIEARVNGWLWGQDDLMDGFRLADAGKDRDVYCKFADTVYGRDITTADKLERFVGKIAVLGLGYQMGAEKFQTTLALGTMGPAVYLDLLVCQRIVQTYRRKNFKIKEGWKICTQIIEDMAAGRTGSFKCISWGANTVYLPNGMTLKYPQLRMKVTGDYPEWTYKRKGEDAKIYGGLLCENIVQALARIIVGVQLLAISKKYRVVMTTHDEVVTIAKTAQGATAYKFMHKCMSTPLDWCLDIPLNADGGFDVIYSK